MPAAFASCCIACPFSFISVSPRLAPSRDPFQAVAFSRVSISGAVATSKLTGAAAVFGVNAILDAVDEVRIAAQNHEPGESDREIAQEDVREDIHRPRWHRVNAADRRDQQQCDRCYRERNGARAEFTAFAEICRGRNRDQKVGPEKAEGAECSGVVEGVENFELEHLGQNDGATGKSGLT